MISPQFLLALAVAVAGLWYVAFLLTRSDRRHRRDRRRRQRRERQAATRDLGIYERRVGPSEPVDAQVIRVLRGRS